MFSRLRNIHRIGSRRLTLVRDYFYWLWNAEDTQPKTPIFVVGCQRSGKTMVLRTLGRSMGCHAYHEGKGTNAAYDLYRLRSDEVLRKLISKSKKRIVAFDPGLDSQHTDRLLALDPNAKAIWIYRNFPDVVHSAVKKWQGDQKNIIRGIADGVKRDPRHHQSAIAERMVSRTLALVRQLSHEGMSAEDGSALLWFARNMIYFDLKLERDSRVLLVKFEDLITKSERFRRVFDFIGCRFSHRYVNGVSNTSCRNDSPPPINPEIHRICAELMHRLDTQYSRSLLPQT